MIYGCGNDDSSGDEIEDSNQEESRDDDNLGEELEGSSQEEFRDVNFELIEQDEHLINHFSDLEIDQYTYKLNFNNKSSLQKFKDKLQNVKNIEQINTIFN